MQHGCSVATITLLACRSPRASRAGVAETERSVHFNPELARRQMGRTLALVVPALLALTAACSGTSQTPTPAARATVPVASSPAATQSSLLAAAATAGPSPATATALPPPSIPTPTPAPPATSTPAAAARVVWVANTQGGGVYLRNSPHDGDRAGVLPDNTQLTATGELVEGDGRNWWPVRTQGGMEGYVPETYTTQTDPQAPPAPLVPDQAR